MKNEIQVDLVIADFPCNPDEITRELGVQPRRTWLEGELVTPGLSMKRKSNGWVLSSGLDKHASYEEHVQALLAIISPNIERFASVCRRYYAEFSCAVYMYYKNGESIPWLGFDKEQTKILGDLGIAVDFDMYVLPNKH